MSKIAAASEEDTNTTGTTTTSCTFTNTNTTTTIFGNGEKDLDKMVVLSINEKELPTHTMSIDEGSAGGRGSPVSNAIKAKATRIICTSTESTLNLNELDTFLNYNIHQASQVKQPWNKLTRHERISMLGVYSRRYLEENNLSMEQEPMLQEYLTSAMDKKRLSKVKEIIYDKDKQIITSIPILSYNTVNKRFTLKRLDKRQSTIKSLTPKKNRSLSNGTKSENGRKGI